MQRFLILLTFLFLSLNVFAQLEVKNDSFKEVVGFVNLNDNPDYQYDDNDQPFAVLKVKTENISDKQRHQLVFEGDLRTYIMYEYKVGEVWLYISYYASYLKISHPDFSSTEFYFPFDLQPKKGYELILVNKSNSNNNAPVKPNFNYLIVKADQPNAVITIDGQYAGEGEVAKSFKVGETHQWKIECELYHPESGSATIVKGDAVKVVKNLRPAFGFININSTPENGATVLIDNKKVGVTPYKSDRLASGQHKVTVMKEMFTTAEKNVTVTDNNTNTVTLNMTAQFVNVKITTNSQSDIYVDNELKGRGSWNGRLSEGEHVFEAKKASHKTAIQNANLVIGRDENITIPDPEPIYGTVDVNSTPLGATILIDDRNCGTSPKILDDVLVGRHQLKLEKDGYKTVTKNFDLDDKNIVHVNETMQTAPKKEPKNDYNNSNNSTASNNTQKSNKNSYDLGFVTFDVAMDNYSKFLYGLTLGIHYSSNIGYFLSYNGKGLMEEINSNNQCGDDFLVNGYYPSYTGKTIYKASSMVVGLILRDSKPLAYRLGIGYSTRVLYYETTATDYNNKHYYVKNTDSSIIGVDFSVGMQYYLRGLLLSVDCVTTSFKCYTVKLGVGIGL